MDALTAARSLDIALLALLWVPAATAAGPSSASTSPAAALGCASRSLASAGWAGAGGASTSVSAAGAFFVGPLNQFDRDAPALLAFAGAGRGAALVGAFLVAAVLLATGALPLALFAGAGAAVGPAASPWSSRKADVTGPNDFQVASASGVAGYAPCVLRSARRAGAPYHS